MPVITGEALIGAGVVLWLIGVCVALWCVAYAAWRVGRWILTGRL